MIYTTDFPVASFLVLVLVRRRRVAAAETQVQEHCQDGKHRPQELKHKSWGSGLPSLAVDRVP